MKADATDFIGPVIVEIVSTLPAWTSDDEGRLIYAEDTNKMYYGDNTQWVDFTG